MTLRHIYSFALTAMTAALVVGGLSAAALLPGAATLAPAAQAPSRVEQLIAEHDCWTGKGPSGVVPERAVVSFPGRRAALVPSEVGFGIWLEGDPGTLHAFCR